MTLPSHLRPLRSLFASSVLALAASSAIAQQAVTYQIVHSFGGTITNANGKSGPDGTLPAAEPAFDSAGNMYGTANQGGANNGGMVWEITSTGVYKDLHDFGGTITTSLGKSGQDGYAPVTAITLDSAGNIYGNTQAGGAYQTSGGNEQGMVWEITKAGVYKDLHDFGGSTKFVDGTTGTDGYLPYAPVRFDSSGNMFGTVYVGGEFDNGEIWEITKSGSYVHLHEFGGTVNRVDGSTGPDGMNAASDVAIDASGNMFGTALFGGTGGGDYSGGMVWKLTKSGAYTDIHDFGGSYEGNGPWAPTAGVTLDGSGNIFGTTDLGATIWEITSSGDYNQLHSFSGTITHANGTTGRDGYNVDSKATLDKYGNLFGTATNGGPTASYGAGLLWELTKAGVYIDLHDFGSSVPTTGGSRITDGANPDSGVTVDSSGNLFGTAPDGGPNGQGVLYKVQVRPVLQSVSLSPSTVTGGSTSTGTVTLSGPAASGGQLVTLAASSTIASAPTGVFVPAGSTSATFTIHTLRVTTSGSWTITAKEDNLSFVATLQVQAATVSSLTVSPTSVVGGASSTGKITLTGPAPDGGLVVTLSSNSSSAGIPSTVTIESGLTSATFKITTSAVASKTTATISAKLGSATTTASLTVNPKS